MPTMKPSRTPHLNFFDPELKAGQVTTTALGLPKVMSGTFASVYEVQTSGTRWAVRCFLQPVKDQRNRYAAVSQHMLHLTLSSLGRVRVSGAGHSGAGANLSDRQDGMGGRRTPDDLCGPLCIPCAKAGGIGKGVAWTGE